MSQGVTDSSREIAAIDVHGHFGVYDRTEASPLERGFMSASPAAVAARATRACTELTFVSPLIGLLPRGGGDPVRANDEAAQAVAETAGLRQWVVVHPDLPATFEQARRFCGRPLTAGIKIHPEEHQYAIAVRGEPLFALATELGAAILAHSGDPLSLPQDYLPLANAHPEVRLILGHLGNGGGSGNAPDLQVRAVQTARHGNVYIDTSSARSLTPGLIEWAVGQVGSDRILFGTDTPLYFAPCQRARIDQAELDLATRRRILRENAVALFGLAP